jgi:hypothetical protein
MRNLSAIISLATLSFSASAHHGAASQFDTDVEISLTGVVTNLRLVNPHSYVTFDLTDDNGDYVLDDSGERISVDCEMLGSTAIRRAGWTREMFEPGTAIKVGGHPSRAEENVCVLETMALNGGPEVTRFAQFEETRPEVDLVRQARTAWGDPNIAGDWAGEARTARPTQNELRAPTDVILSDVGQAAADELLAEIRAGLAAGDIEDPRLNCQARDFITDWTFNWMPNRIVQDEDEIQLTYGFMDRARTIHMDMAEHPANLASSLSGHSIGRWEGDVLIVDTIGFSESYRYTRDSITRISSDQYHVIERFTVDNDNGTLTREYEATDAWYWTDGSRRVGKDVLSISNLPWEPYRCNDLTVE